MNAFAITFRGIIRSETGSLGEAEAMLFPSSREAQTNLRKCQERWPKSAKQFRIEKVNGEIFCGFYHWGERALEEKKP